MNDTSANDQMSAKLAFDSRRRPIHGMRSGGATTRRMLFSSQSTFVELALPASTGQASTGLASTGKASTGKASTGKASTGKTVSLHGSVLSDVLSDTGSISAAGICVIVTTGDGRETAAFTDANGEFVAEVHSTSPFRVRCEVPGQDPVHLSVDDA